MLDLDLEHAEALRSGDPEAFRLLVERETTAVFRTCYRILGRVDEAEDAAQDAFVQAYRALASYRGDGPAGAWLARIATREAWRRSGRSRRRTVAELSDTHRLIQLDPLSEAVATEQREVIRLAVATLPDPYREVVALRFFSELSVADIATAMGRPEGTIKAQLHRGLQRLRGSLTQA
ncbi:MAG: sigma-70 family RNA polymerase sigma factor, partial [Candidatus Limnocylindrales bacterium]